MQTMDNATTTTPQCRQQRHDADNNSMMEMMGNNTDDNDGDNGADDNADVDTDDNAVAQTTNDGNTDNNAREVKTVGGILEAKMGRGGGPWGCRGGHWCR
jgi:hypothetical protein